MWWIFSCRMNQPINHSHETCTNPFQPVSAIVNHRQPSLLLSAIHHYYCSCNTTIYHVQPMFTSSFCYLGSQSSQKAGLKSWCSLDDLSLQPKMKLPPKMGCQRVYIGGMRHPPILGINICGPRGIPKQALLSAPHPLVGKLI